MNLKVPGAIFPLGCAILSTRAKTVGGLVQPPLRRTRVNVLTILDRFAQLSGLCINHKKSDAIWIGSLKNNDYKIGNVNWKLFPDNTIKIVGITFSPNIPLEEMNRNWDEKMKKIESSIRAWKMQGLSMIGRNLIVKTLLASQLTYIATAITIPDDVVRKINNMFVKFIWNRGEAVKRNTAIADFDMGGIKMFHVNSFFNSLKMSWIKKLANEEVAVWKNIALYHVSKTGLRIDLFNCNCSLKEMNAECIRTIDKLPMFYSSMIKSWFSTKPVVYKHNIDDPRAEIIWNNNAIQLNGKTLFIRDWITEGFIRVCDLFDNHGNMLSLQAIKDRMPYNGRVFIDYYIIRNALPSNWQSHSGGFDYTSEITFNNVAIRKCSAGMFKKAMIESMYIKPKCQHFWENKFPNNDFNWEMIWSKIPHCTKEARLISLNWKILHNIYPTKTMLYRMGKEESNICNKCNVIDHVDHFFYSCGKTSIIWDKVNFVISHKLNKNTSLTVTDVLFGVHDKNVSNKDTIFINHVIAIAKLCISKYRYGNHPNLLFLFDHEFNIRYNSQG